METDLNRDNPTAPLVLTVDHGNTAIKLSVWRSDASGRDSLVERRLFEHTQLDELFEWIDARSPQGGIYCSVGHMDVRLIESLRCLLGDTLLVLTHSTPLPIAVDYATPRTLGLDRVAAAAGAAVAFPGQRCVIADAGTALTTDLLTADGTFAGGRISPGLRLRCKALNHYTARLPIVEPAPDAPLTGTDTVSSILSGVMWGMGAEIAAAITQMNPDKAVICGGDAPMIIPYINLPGAECQEVTHIPELMGLGLLSIYRHNTLLTETTVDNSSDFHTDIHTNIHTDILNQ